MGDSLKLSQIAFLLVIECRKHILNIYLKSNKELLTKYAHLGQSRPNLTLNTLQINWTSFILFQIEIILCIY